MRRLFRWMGATLASLLTCGAMGILAFDLMTVRPAVSRIEDRLRVAAPSERQPPKALMDMLHRAYGERINGLVAREVLTSANLVESMGTLRRRLTELGLMWLLPFHLSDADIASAYLAGAYMGLETPGFASASQRYLGIGLDHVDLAQAAKLVAIAHAPSIYAHNPERLERRVQYLLALAPR